MALLVHDLRNQLAVIMECTDSIADLLPPGCGEVEIAALRQCAQRSSALTRDLLIAAKPSRMNRTTVDLNEVVATAMVPIRRLAGPQVRVRLQLAGYPVLVLAEALELERILMNLVLNACDAMVATDLQRERCGESLLTIDTAVENDSPPGSHAPHAPQARLRVADNGRGMTTDVKARMFEPFFSTRSAGTGLGLSSVAFTVRQLRGSVAVQSAPGEGTTISVYFPVSTPNAKCETQKGKGERTKEEGEG